jgi:hypothetical protein
LPNRGSERSQDGSGGFAAGDCQLITVRAGDFRAVSEIL